MNVRMAGIDSMAMAGFGRRAFARLHAMQSVIVLILGVGGTLLALGLVVHELWDRELTPLVALARSGMAFWAAFIAMLLIEPVCDYAILRRLLGTGAETLAPLVRKQSLNALLFGYAGDTYFLTWLQKRTGDARAAFALVCDMTIGSALVNNLATLVMLVVMWRPVTALAGGRIDGWTLAVAVALVGVPILLIGVRRRALPSEGLPTILAFQTLRTVLATVLAAATWHFALPSVPMLSWLLLLTGRMIVSRLPIIPNKDLAFAGIVAIMLGPNEQVVPVIAGVALMTLVAQAVMIAVAALPGVGGSWGARGAVAKADGAPRTEP
ncbi:hypothetical protein LWE61_07335 [Sphingobium sufflavum]|uniref:hypothetical protein n=1 Tax=Sphingobium sufflavum TaxID=1129547 RepID=UPI001F35B038|nr:hypothetical protein [Sphingobium sufflavum]MCE7796373.1 hypothetical protein [Sphingobium sufflavum]